MAQLNLSHTLTAGTPENINDVQDNFQDIVDHVNDALIGDDNLTSPNNSVWRTLRTAWGVLGSSQAAGTFVLDGNALVQANGGNSNWPLWKPTAADYAVGGKTAVVRLVNSIAGGNSGSAHTGTFSAELRPISSITNQAALSLGSAALSASSSLSAINSVDTDPSSAVNLSTLTNALGYVLCVTSSAATPAGSILCVTADLQIRHT